MADPRFFRKADPIPLQKLAEISGGMIFGQGKSDIPVNDVAPLDIAGAGDISFLDNKKYFENFRRSRAGFCIVHQTMVGHAPNSMTLLVSKDPYRSYALVARAFYPCQEHSPAISEKALVSESARFGDGVNVEAGAFIGRGVEIGHRVSIGANSVIEDGVVLGNDVVIASSVTISHAIIGNRVVIYSGVRIGQDGFGYAMGAEHVKVPQLGRVLIEDDVEIGANTTIDRGAGPDTVIGRGCKIDNLVQIGHNVQMGQGCIVVAQTGIAGSTKLGNFVILGGQAGIAGHLNFGDGARVAAKGGVMRDVPAGVTVGGIPAVPMVEWMRQTAVLRRLVNKNDK